LTACSDDINNLQAILNSDLNNSHQWIVANKLTLNVGKTEYMIIGTRQKLGGFSSEMNINIGGKNLIQVVSKKVLGIIIDDQLRWDEQIDNISNKVSQGIGMLRRAKQFVKRETLQFLYNSMVQPYFEYCSLVWGNCGESLKEKLQKLQNRAARVITGDTYDIRSKDILKKLNWKKPIRKKKRKSKCVCFKSYYRKLPEKYS
jgi:hypothetical protein